MLLLPAVGTLSLSAVSVGTGRSDVQVNTKCRYEGGRRPHGALKQGAALQPLGTALPYRVCFEALKLLLRRF